MSACPDCGAALQTPLVCEGCGALQSTAAIPSPFEVLGLVRGWHVDSAELGRNLLRLTRLTHPDFHGIHGNACCMNEQNSVQGVISFKRCTRFLGQFAAEFPLKES
ncbi:MAG: hypothetical protein ABGY29_10980, partial [bacterium]